MHLIQQIGSYAGLAAIPGLAVLSALYFSQARDVRRLREWAGRAPERAAEQAMGGRVAPVPGQPAQPGVAQPAAAQPAAVAAGAGAVKPAVAAATATGAKPATAAAPATGAKPATAAAPAAGKTAVPETAAGTNGTTEGAEAEEGAAAKPAALTPAAVASAAAARAAAGAGGTVPRSGPPAVGGGVGPATPGATKPRRHIPSLPHSSRTSVLGVGTRPVDPWYRRLGARLPAGRYIALIVAGALVLGGGAAFAISQLSSGSGGGGSSAAKSPGAPAQSGGKSAPKKNQNVKAAPTIDPTKVTVTVVNGTAIPNLARDTATKLSQLGFQIGNKVTGTGSLAAAESVVEYRPGAEAEARFVAAKLKISQKQPADQDAIAQAGPAQVIVVLGADQAPGG
ncbi:MAG: hypothetical protein QOC77_1159 [Thermoleophilaceae bacterium]|jgi:hypothetical protein|nr:hypothetical protein [Thermoleophilaceae bacterium]